MKANDLKIGDIVFLNSGGPPMAVTEIKLEGNITRVWWWSPDGFKVAEFPAACLTKENPTGGHDDKA